MDADVRELLEELAQGFSLSYNDVSNEYECVFCDAWADTPPVSYYEQGEAEGWREAHTAHEPDCLISRARALLKARR